MESPSRSSWSTASPLTLLSRCIGLRPTRYAQALLLERSPFPSPPATSRLGLRLTSDLCEGKSHASLNNRDTNLALRAENFSWNVIITTIPWLYRPSGARQHPPHQSEAMTLTKRLIANRSNYTQHAIHAPRRTNGASAWIQVSPEACARDASTQMRNFGACTLTPSRLRSRDATLAGRQDECASRRNPAQLAPEPRILPCIHKSCGRCGRLEKECVWSGAEERRALIDLCRSLPVFEAVGGEKTQVSSRNDKDGNGERGDEEERS